MAEAAHLPVFVRGLTAALGRRFPKARVDFESLNGTGWYRFMVVSSGFQNVSHPARQKQVWSVVDSALGPEDQMEISMSLTLTPEDVWPQVVD